MISTPRQSIPLKSWSREKKEIASALARARVAEASANGAEKLLLELKVRVGPMVVTAQATSEQ